MKFCTACGHELGDGRFCTSCGTPVAPAGPDDDRTDTAERPAVRLPPPAPVGPPPSGSPVGPPPGPPVEPPSTLPTHRSEDYSARYPLFADDPDTGAETSLLPTYQGADGGTPWSPVRNRGRRVWPVFLGIGVVLAVILALGIMLLGGGDQAPSSTPATGASNQTTSAQPSASDQPSTKPAQPVKPPKNTTNLARTATAKAPVTAPPNQDIRGNIVRYVATNMLDGVASTAWRMPGDGTGTTLTFTLPSEAVLTDVGLINGYAKVDRAGKGPAVNWYNRNRKVTEVEWTFDDGTTVTQTLDLTRRLQALSIPPERTTTVKLKLLAVSAPGVHDGRNYTPISDVLLVGG